MEEGDEVVVEDEVGGEQEQKEEKEEPMDTSATQGWWALIRVGVL